MDEIPGDIGASLRASGTIKWRGVDVYVREGTYFYENCARQFSRTEEGAK